MSHIANILSVRKRRLSLQREADLLEQEEKGLVNDLINFMNTDGRSVWKEGEDEVTLIESTEPVVNEWPKVLDYIIENDAVDLLQKRLTASAVKKRWDDGVSIPGIVASIKQSLKFNV
jgi:hypothetical protein